MTAQGLPCHDGPRPPRAGLTRPHRCNKVVVRLMALASWAWLTFGGRLFALLVLPGAGKAACFVGSHSAVSYVARSPPKDPDVGRRISSAVCGGCADNPLARHVLWPSKSGCDFAAACKEAVALGVPVAMAPGSSAFLQDRLRLSGNRDTLRIVGGPGCTIEGAGHSVFQLAGRHAHLDLQGDVCVVHSARTETGDGKDVGAAIFAMGRSSVNVTGTTITSKSGLGIWMAQRARLHAADCNIVDCGRSGLAMFVNTTALLVNCSFSRCNIHGACARGQTQLKLLSCQITFCGRRGIYAYERCSLDVQDCTVKGTSDPSRAAVEAAGARAGNGVVARIMTTNVVDNMGVGVRLRGAVEYELQRNTCTGNVQGDVHVTTGEENGKHPQAYSRPSGRYGRVLGHFGPCG